MRSKRENTILTLEKTPVLRCPLCQSPIQLVHTSLRCKNNHNFDINRKGYVNFMQKNTYGLYDRDLFLARRHIIDKYYNGFIKKLNDVLKSHSHTHEVIVDAGCGEGSYLSQIDTPFRHKIGIDLATDGIQLATDDFNCLWLIADLANLPLRDNSVNVILNILSPANYQEFKRVLAKDGVILKVIPNSNYLKELRTTPYSNEDVYNIIAEQLEIIDEVDYFEEVHIDPSDREDIKKMSPLDGHQNHFDSITLDLKIIIAKEK